jgi:hypothetical protein
MSAASQTLTRTDEVLAVLRAGGRAQQGHGDQAGLWSLFDAAGRQLPAWNNAIKAAHRIHTNPRPTQRTPQ